MFAKTDSFNALLGPDHVQKVNSEIGTPRLLKSFAPHNVKPNVIPQGCPENIKIDVHRRAIMIVPVTFLRLRRRDGFQIADAAFFPTEFSFRPIVPVVMKLSFDDARTWT